MSELIAKRVKQLENQNERLRKLLDCTLQITSEENEKCLSPKSEVSFLKKVMRDLENQKKILQEELNLHVEADYWIPDNPAKNKDNIENKLNMAIQEVQDGTLEMRNLDVEDDYLKVLIMDLEKKKERLFFDLHLVKKADGELNALAQENLKLKNELARLESQCSGTNYGTQDLIDKLSEIEDKKVQLQSEINSAKGKPDVLGIPIESTVLELKILGLDKQKQEILKTLNVSLLQSANEVSTLHTNTTDGQLRGLLNELDVHKTIFMINLNDVKELHLQETNKKKITRSQLLNDTENRLVHEKENFNVEGANVKALKEFLIPRSGMLIPQSVSSFDVQNSQIIQKISEIRGAKLSLLDPFETGFRSCDELATGSVDKKRQTEALMEQEQLKEQLRGLERNRDEHLEHVAAMNEVERDAIKTLHQDELHETFIGQQLSEEVQKLPLDDATNQMYVNEEQLFAQRIKEFEEDNESIIRNMSAMMEEAHVEKGDMEPLMDEREKRSLAEES